MLTRAKKGVFHPVELLKEKQTFRSKISKVKQTTEFKANTSGSRILKTVSELTILNEKQRTQILRQVETLVSTAFVSQTM